MGSTLAVILEPLGDDLASVLATVEPVGVQALVAKPAVETLHEGVVDRFGRAAEVQMHAVRVSPLIKDIRDELRTVVDRDGARITVLRSKLREKPDDVWPSDASLHYDTGRAACERVDERQDAEAVTVARAVADESNAQALRALSLAAEPDEATQRGGVGASRVGKVLLRDRADRPACG